MRVVRQSGKELTSLRRVVPVPSIIEEWPMLSRRMCVDASRLWELTTSSTASAVPFRSNRFLHVVMLLFSLVWIASAVKPEIPEDWFLENLLVFILIALLASSYRWLPFSDCSYLLIFVFLCLHECGAHYQYSGAAPGEWMKLVFHGESNHYDRLGHF